MSGLTPVPRSDRARPGFSYEAHFEVLHKKSRSLERGCVFYFENAQRAEDFMVQQNMVSNEYAWVLKHGIQWNSGTLDDLVDSLNYGITVEPKNVMDKYKGGGDFS